MNNTKQILYTQKAKSIIPSDILMRQRVPIKSCNTDHG